MDEPPRIASKTASPMRSVEIIRRVANPIWLRVGIAAVLEVPGRRTGTTTRVTVAPVEVEGTWYLLSTYGLSDRVLNLRAAGHGQLRHKGRTEAITAIEVDGDERDRVIAAFHAKTPKPFSTDFDRLPDAADHPAFKVEPVR